MALIIAVFLGLYILFKLMGEGVAKSAYKQQVYDTSKRREEFEDLVIDDDADILVYEMLCDVSKKEEIFEDVNALLKKYSYEECESFQYLPRDRYDTEFAMLRRVLLARKGKVPDRDMSFISKMYLPPQSPAESRELRKLFKKLYVCVEKELQEHGVPVRLVVVVGAESRDRNGSRVHVEKEMYWVDYDDPTEYGKLTDNIHHFKWEYCPEDRYTLYRRSV